MFETCFKEAKYRTPDNYQNFLIFSHLIGWTLIRFRCVQAFLSTPARNPRRSAVFCRCSMKG